MTVETIFFDKDGTLMEFDPFWISVTEYTIKDILSKYKVDTNVDEDTEAILSMLGVADNKTDVDAVLCKGTYAEIAEVIYGFLTEKGCNTELESFKASVMELYNKNMDKGKVVPTCENIRGVLEKLRDKGINLCVVTTDDEEITHECLKKLDIIDMFKYIYTDDGKVAPKPNPACMNEYCAETGIAKDRIVMVGDTATDIRFARNAGVSVVCVGNAENRSRLEKNADVAISNISYIDKAIEVL